MGINGNILVKIIIQKLYIANINITSSLPEGSTRYVVNVTDTITFQCIATGVPPPDIQWYRGIEILNSSSDSRVTIRSPIIDEPERALVTVTRELILASTSDSGSGYDCRATNAAMKGEDSEGFELYVQGNYLLCISCLILVLTK